MSDPTKRPPSEWLADIEESEAQADAGDVVPAEVVLQQLQESIARLEARRDDKRRRKAASHR